MSGKQTQMMILIQDLVLAFVINSTATVLNGGLKGTDVYLVGMFMAFSINYVSGLIIPVEKLGNAVASGIRLKKGKLLHKLVRIFVINAISTISSIGLCDIPGYEGSEGSLLAVGDSAVCTNPNPEQLASIAISACDTVRELTHGASPARSSQ